MVSENTFSSLVLYFPGTSFVHSWSRQEQTPGAPSFPVPSHPCFSGQTSILTLHCHSTFCFNPFPEGHFCTAAMAQRSRDGPGLRDSSCAAPHSPVLPKRRPNPPPLHSAPSPLWGHPAVPLRPRPLPPRPLPPRPLPSPAPLSPHTPKMAPPPSAFPPPHERPLAPRPAAT